MYGVFNYFFLGAAEASPVSSGTRTAKTNEWSTVEWQPLGHQLCDSCLLAPVLKRLDAARVKDSIWAYQPRGIQRRHISFCCSVTCGGLFDFF